MEDVTAELGDNIKGTTEKASSDSGVGAKVNGDVNGSMEEAMDVDAPQDVSSSKNSVPESSRSQESAAKIETRDEDEPMEVDNNVSDLPCNPSPKRDTQGVCDAGLPIDSVKNGPSAREQRQEDSVGDNPKDSCEITSDQSDIRDDSKLESVDNVSAEAGGSIDLSKENSASGSVIEQDSKEEQPSKSNSLQNGESSEDVIADDPDTDEVKDLSKDSKNDEESTPEKGDSERNDGESEESPDGSTPSKKGKGRKNPVPLSLTPRRSSRNLNKQKSYAEDKEEPPEKDDSSDIEEIAIEPVGGSGDQQNKENSKARGGRTSTNKTIVVNDTKHLVEIASGSKQSNKGQKKEPTLVIIDTNSIMSGRSPIPVGPNKIMSRPGLQITPAHMPSSSPSSSSSLQQSFSVLPVAGHNQTVFSSGVTATRVSAPPPPPQPIKPPVILPSLTDDMYVVEAPSFIVPYVYEKPPIKPLKDFIEDLEGAIKKAKLEEEEIKKKEEAEKKKEDGPKEGESESEKKDDSSPEKAKEEPKSDTEKDVKMDTDIIEGKKDGKDGEDSKSVKDTKDGKDDGKDKDDTALREESKSEEKKDESAKDPAKPEGDDKKSSSYFDNPLGKFFIQIGTNLVQEHVQTDLLRSQKKKRDREGGKGVASTQMAISSLQQTLEYSKENNEPFHLKQKKCDYCSFKTESALVMAHHMETPHMRNYIYRCNFCDKEVRSPHDILFHMEAEHNVRGKLERGPAFHQCPNCPFEDNQKGKLTRHLVSCQKKYRPEKNQEPPLDWEPPAKIPRVSRSRPFPMGATAMAGMTVPPKPGMVGPQHPLLPKLPVGSSIVGQPNLSQMANTLGIGRGRGRPPVGQTRFPDLKAAQAIQQQQQQQRLQAPPMPGMLYRSSPSGPSQVLVPTPYQIAGNPIYQNNKGQASKLQQQPSISITPLPRQPSGTPPNAHSTGVATGSNKPGHPSTGGKATFVICEICDGYIKDLEQLRNHMQWIHKVKIHPKMIYNRPPLNCQKCQFRFFTDQGLERHLLGSHGLVTSSMQEAANKGKDGGRCPVCGRVYQWKLLNHVARDHSMTLKPAHLSYKCTVCTATFGMYKQFENHVYSAHSVVAKRVMDKKPGSTSASSSPSVSRSPAATQQGDSLLIKPLKINDEITIIPQPSRSARPSPAGRSGPMPAHMQGGKAGDDRLRRPGGDDGVQIIDLDDSPSKDALSAVQERLRRRTSLEVSQVETEDDLSPAAKKNRRD